MGKRKKLRNLKRAKDKKDKEYNCVDCDNCEKLRKKIEDKMKRDKRADQKRIKQYAKGQKPPGAGGIHGVKQRHDELISPGSNKGLSQTKTKVKKSGNFKTTFIDHDYKPRAGHIQALEDAKNGLNNDIDKFMRECLDKYDKDSKRKLNKRMAHGKKLGGMKAPSRAMRRRMIQKFLGRTLLRSLNPALRIMPPELLFPQPMGPPEA